MNVSDADRFVWDAQAFESFCESHGEIYAAAEAMKSPKQSFPNLRSYLAAAQSVLGFPGNYDSYFKNAKDVRNYYTHNNPEIKVTQNQEKNSYKLVHYYLRKSIAKVFGIPCLKSSFVLISEGEK